ncbi:Dynein attachment factor, N-terminal,RNA-polymerase II-associated protein 3-like, C-terminal [Cinara cedri]|uniref:Dynein attachment factor, N-terminal,RNA-polymerase II-associated protein 3-like, C-terminal n=1 Tax=Cinara cedri TaxID=506608 RepID=A0A5E4N7W7_9HEMI|nr:Dynein attachment factor, N-terminal,RNA-polymerase II-associated protein 3-like, C-terminal [Cinara cedri]
MGSADFSSLENELIDNVEKDVRYWQQNDAKLRAVKSVSTYQEFSDIVKAAHLRPLTKKEIEAKGQGPSASTWNNITRGTVQDTCGGKQSAADFVAADVDSVKDHNIPGPCSPKVQEFINSFRRLVNAKHRYKYLSLHGAEHVPSTFQNEEIPPSVLVELLETLLIFPSNSVSDIVSVTRLLDVITSTKRFELAIEFLSSTELDTLCNLFDKLEESLKSGQQDLAEQGVTEWSLSTLRRKYNV